MLVGSPCRPESVGQLGRVEAGETADEDPLIDLGAEEDEPTALFGEAVAERPGQAREETLAHEAAQVIGHLARPVGRPQMVRHELAQRSRADVGGGPAEVRERTEERHHPGIAEAEPGGPSLRWSGGAHEGLERGRRGHAALGLALQGEEPRVDGPPDLDERGQVLQAPADAEVVGVVDGRLGAQRPIELPVLLDLRAAVLDLERWLGSGTEDASPEGRSPVAQDAVLEEELQPLRPAQVELIGDDRLEEGPAMGWTVEDLGAADLELEDGELVAVARLDVGLAEGRRQASQPPPDEALDGCGGEPVADLLRGPVDRRPRRSRCRGTGSRYGDPRCRRLAQPWPLHHTRRLQGAYVQTLMKAGPTSRSKR